MSNTPTAFIEKSPGAADHVRIFLGDRDTAGVPVYVLMMDDARGIHEALHELFNGAAPAGHVTQAAYDALLDKYHDLAVRVINTQPVPVPPPAPALQDRWWHPSVTPSFIQVGTGSVTAADGLASHNVD